LYEWVKVTVA